MSEGARVRTKKMLLVAAVGVGTVNYVACGDATTSGNFMVLDTTDAAVPDAAVPDVATTADAADDQFMTSGNLIAPLPDATPDAPSTTDGAADARSDSAAAQDAALDVFIGSGNLVAPLPDAGAD
jgi:hypothetical protein